MSPSRLTLLKARGARSIGVRLLAAAVLPCERARVQTKQPLLFLIANHIGHQLNSSNGSGSSSSGRKDMNLFSRAPTTCFVEIPNHVPRTRGTSSRHEHARTRSSRRPRIPTTCSPVGPAGGRREASTPNSDSGPPVYNSVISDTTHRRSRKVSSSATCSCPLATKGTNVPWRSVFDTGPPPRTVLRAPPLRTSIETRLRPLHCTRILRRTLPPIQAPREHLFEVM